VLLLVALNDRKVRIEVGYALKRALPDATANRIIQQDIAPAFKRGDYYNGISTGVDRIMRVIEGELSGARVQPPAAGIPGMVHLLPFLFIFALVGGSIFRRLFGRVGGALATGGLVGFLTWMLISILGISLFAGIVAFIFALMGGIGRRRAGRRWQRLYAGVTAAAGLRGGFGGGLGGGRGFWRGASAAVAVASVAAAPSGSW